MQRDLKTENILLRKIGQDGGLRAVAGDLGTALTLEAMSCAETRVGTKDCMAPELYFVKPDEKLNYKPQLVDVYGLGKLGCL